MDQKLKPIESFVRQGLAQRFQQLFGAPLAWSNSPNKKETVVKLQQKGLTYPFALASLTGESIAEGSYKPHALLRRGLVSGASSDQVLAHRLNLIPVTTDIEITYICKSMAEVLAFKRYWLLACIQNGFKFSVLYGLASLDIHVAQERRVNVPQSEGSLNQANEYMVTTTMQVSGYLSYDEIEKAQAVLEVEGTFIVDQQILTAEKLTKTDPFVYGVSAQQKYLLHEVGEPVSGGNLIDISLMANTYNLVLNENRSIGFTGFKADLDGKRFVLRVTQGDPGGFLINWDTNSVRFGGDIPDIELTDEPGRYDYIGFIYRHASQQCDLIAFSRNYE